MDLSQILLQVQAAKDGTFMDKSIREAAEEKNNRHQNIKEENKHQQPVNIGRKKN